MLFCNSLSLRRQQKLLLDNINYQLRKDALTVIVGPNGAGKTSLLRCFAGLEPSVYPHLSLGGRAYSEISASERARLSAWCPELLQYGEGFSVSEVVVLGRFPWHRGFPGNKDRKIMEELLEIFQLTAKSTMPLSTLSSGELRKTMIARTLAQDTPLVLLDEPCANLDIGASLQLLTYLQGLTRQGRTVCICLHDLILTRKFAQQLVVLEQGRLLAAGETAEVFAGGRGILEYWEQWRDG